MLTFLNFQIAHFSVIITISFYAVLLALVPCLSFQKLVSFTLLFLDPLPLGGSLHLFDDDFESLFLNSLSPQPSTYYYYCLGTFCIRNSTTAKLANTILPFPTPPSTKMAPLSYFSGKCTSIFLAPQGHNFKFN